MASIVDTTAEVADGNGNVRDGTGVAVFVCDGGRVTGGFIVVVLVD
jgi:hypothetical protein